MSKHEVFVQYVKIAGGLYIAFLLTKIAYGL